MTKKNNWNHILEESDIQWPKGEILTYSYNGGYCMYRYDGASEDGSQIYFRTGNLGLMAHLFAKLTKKEIGIEQIHQLEEFVELIGVKPSSKAKEYSMTCGFTPLELVAKGDEHDRMLKVKTYWPKKVFEN